MVEVNCYNGGSGSVATVNVDASPFGDAVRKRLLRQAYLHYSAAHRAGTHSTLTRAEVNFNERKPWKQKGTGRARSGDFSSPVWRKGGIVFGPKPRSYVNGLNRRSRREALRSALLAKLNDGELKLVDGLRLDKPSTKQAAAALQALGCTKGRTLVVLPALEGPAYRSFRNLAKVTLEVATNVNAEHVLDAHHAVMEKSAYEAIVGRLSHA